MDLFKILMVGLGGFAGSICRYLLGLWLKPVGESFPVGTFSANILGCLIIGVAMASFAKNQGDTSTYQLLIATGFCGGFTTFSSFSLENLQLLQNGHLGTFALYAIGSLVLGLLAVALGWKLAFSI